jgi:hypothetical protein
LPLDKIAGVTEDQLRRRVIIDVKGPASEPSGWVDGGKGRRTPFDGWLQLLTALESAMKDDEKPGRECQ